MKPALSWFIVRMAMSVLAGHLSVLACHGVHAQDSQRPDRPGQSAETSADTHGEDSQVTPVEIQRLIGQLSDGDFRVRERASTELFELHARALGHLESPSSKLPHEARRRVQIIRKRIQADVFQNIANRFLTDLDASNSYDLPAWDAFRRLVGSTRTAKLLYLEVLKHQPEVVQAVEQLANASEDESSDSTELHRRLLSVSIAKAEALIPQIFSSPRPEMGKPIGLLFTVGHLEGQAPVEVSEAVLNMTRLSFDGLLNKPGYRECLRRLLGGWVPKTHEAIAPDVLRISLEHEIASCLGIARAHLSENHDVNVRELAFHCIAKFGDRSDVERLLAYLDDTTIVDEVSEVRVGGLAGVSAAPPGVQAEPADAQNKIVRINDLATACCMLLLEQDPASIFPDFEPNEFQMYFSPDLTVDPSAVEERDARIQKWREKYFPNVGES